MPCISSKENCIKRKNILRSNTSYVPLSWNMREEESYGWKISEDIYTDILLGSQARMKFWKSLDKFRQFCVFGYQSLSFVLYSFIPMHGKQNVVWHSFPRIKSLSIVLKVALFILIGCLNVHQKDTWNYYY